MDLGWIIEQAVLEARGFDLRKLKELGDDLGDVRHYIMSNLFDKHLGAGQARDVYMLSPKRVLKVAKGRLGIYQNREEAVLGRNQEFSGLVARVYDSAPNSLWVVSELVRPVTEDEFYELSGVWFDVFEKLVYAGGHSNKLPTDDVLVALSKSYQSKGVQPEKFVAMAKSSFMQQVYRLLSDGEVLKGDVVKPEHWGKAADGRLVMLDYGWTEDAADSYNILGS